MLKVSCDNALPVKKNLSIEYRMVIFDLPVFGLLEEDLLYWRLYFSLFVQSPVIALVEDRPEEVMQEILNS